MVFIMRSILSHVLALPIIVETALDIKSFK